MEQNQGHQGLPETVFEIGIKSPGKGISFSENVEKLFEAVSQFNSECPEIEKSESVKVTTRNGSSYSFSYASLDQIINKTRPVLAKHGLSIMQFVGSNGSVRTMLSHSSGQWIISDTLLIENAKLRDSADKNDGGGEKKGASPQEMGSAITYAKRYQMSSFLNIASEEDDDANSASGNQIERLDPNRPWINKGTDDFKKAEKDLASGAAKFSDIEKLFRINKEHSAYFKGIEAKAKNATPPAPANTDSKPATNTAPTPAAKKEEPKQNASGTDTKVAENTSAKDLDPETVAAEEGEFDLDKLKSMESSNEAIEYMKKFNISEDEIRNSIGIKKDGRLTTRLIFEWAEIRFGSVDTHEPEPEEEQVPGKPKGWSRNGDQTYIDEKAAIRRSFSEWSTVSPDVIAEFDNVTRKIEELGSTAEISLPDNLNLIKNIKSRVPDFPDKMMIMLQSITNKRFKYLQRLSS